MKKDIQSREDIYKLVQTFYSKVRGDEILAPFFSMVKDWDEHMDRLTTFWESSIFLTTKYLGDPLKVHVEVDRTHGNQIEHKHFGHWMNLWYETVDELFEGEKAQIAKNRAKIH